MKSGTQMKILFPTIISFMILILDGQTALSGAQSGIKMCLQAVIPSLFPFIFLSSLLTASLLSMSMKGSSRLCKVLGLPKGAEGIFLTGLIGGYPVGAKCIAEAVREGRLCEESGERMLIFCNSAGPSFIFGIVGTLFKQRWIPWLLWGINLLSLLCMGRIFTVSSGPSLCANHTSDLSITQRLRQSVTVMGEICGWIVLMKTVITIAQKWIFQMLSPISQILITGLLDLANGCIALGTIQNTGLRFILCSVFLSFGGLCVALQTASAAPELKRRIYIPGKLIQAIISFAISYVIQYFFFTDKIILPWLFLSALPSLLVPVSYQYRKQKKSCGNSAYISV